MTQLPPKAGLRTPLAMRSLCASSALHVGLLTALGLALGTISAPVVSSALGAQVARSEPGIVLPPEPRELEREQETDERLEAPELLEPREQFDTETDNEPIVHTPDAIWEDPPPVLPESRWPTIPLRPSAEEPELATQEELPVVFEPVPVTPSPPAPVAADRGPLLIHQPRPRYPRLAWRLGVEGSVEVRMHVRADGSVRSVEVLESSGSRQLDEAAQKALLDWRFEPALRAGVAVAESYEHRVRFALQS